MSKEKLSNSAIRSLPLGDFFADLGIGNFNFQSGFGNLNDISDSIGSIFGMGPEDRDSVTKRFNGAITEFIQGVITRIPQIGIDGAISLLREKKENEIRAKKSFKSSNSKHGAQLWVDAMKEFISKLEQKKAQDKRVQNQEDNSSSDNAENSGSTNTLTATKSQSKNLMFGVGAVLLLMKFTKIFK